MPQIITSSEESGMELEFFWDERSDEDFNDDITDIERFQNGGSNE